MHSAPRVCWIVISSLGFVWALLPGAATVAAEPGSTGAAVDAPAGAEAAAPEDYERWYILKLQGEPAGWWVSRQEVDGDRVTTGMEMEMTVARAGVSLSIAMGMRFEETAGGEPIKAQVRQKMARSEQKQVLEFDPAAGEATLITLDEANRVVTRRTVDMPERDWLPPAAASRYAAERIAAGDERFALWTIDPTSGVKPIRLEVEVLGEEKIEVGGRTVLATKTRVATQVTPTTKVTGVEYLDERGIPVRQIVHMANVKMQLDAADKALAQAEREPVELLNDTLIRPSRPIASPRQLRRATYILSGGAGAEKLPDLPNSPVQRVERLGDRRFRIEIDLDAAREEAGDVEEPAVERSRMIDGSDARVAALTERALEGVAAGDAGAKAAALRRFVYDYIDEKSLGVGMASATEVARTGEGDCTEHAVLLAAMLRAAEIPSRVASGLIYVNESGLGEDRIFGYHAWTQAWIDGRWVDLDAVLPAGQQFDATHILLRTSPMADGEWSNDLVDLAPLIGGIEIEVASTGEGE